MIFALFLVFTANLHLSGEGQSDADLELSSGDFEFSDFSDETNISETNTTEPTHNPKNQGVPLYVGIACIAVIIVVVVVVSIILKKKGDQAYDPTVDLGLVENEIL